MCVWGGGGGSKAEKKACLPVEYSATGGLHHADPQLYITQQLMRSQGVKFLQSKAFSKSAGSVSTKEIYQ